MEYKKLLLGAFTLLATAGKSLASLTSENRAISTVTPAIPSLDNSMFFQDIPTIPVPAAPPPTVAFREKILFVTHTTLSGRGDYDYLIALSNPDYLRKVGYDLDKLSIERVAVVPVENDTLIKASGVSKVNAARQRIEDIRRSGGEAKDECLELTVEDLDIDEAGDGVKVIIQPTLVYTVDGQLNIPKTNPSERLFNELIINNPEYADVTYIVGISSSQGCVLARMYNKKNVDITHINCLGGFDMYRVDDVQNSQYSSNSVPTVSMQNTHLIGTRSGFYMPEKVSPLDEVARSQQLLELQDKAYLMYLVSAQAPTITDVTYFLKNTLFVPAYFQNKGTIKAFIEILARYNLDTHFKDGITVHLSMPSHVYGAENSKTSREKIELRSRFIHSLLPQYLAHELRIKGYSHLEIEGERIPIADKSETTRVFRIISQLRFENKHDFDSLYGAAQLIAGTSGDNTLNNALARGVFVYHDTPKWAKNFRNEFVKVLCIMLENFDFIDKLEREGLYYTEQDRELARQLIHKFILAPLNPANTLSYLLKNLVNKAIERNIFPMLKHLIIELHEKYDFDKKMGLLFPTLLAKHEVNEIPSESTLTQKGAGRYLR